MSNSYLKRIAAINDISGVGKCSLTVALPVVSASGVECSCLPTTVLSTHTCEFKGFTLRDLSDDIVPVAEHWAHEKVHFDGICSGYMANAGQAKLIYEAIQLIKSEDTLIVVDPAMADNGAYYAMLGDDIRDEFRSLCAIADIITPNVTEAAFLAGIPYMAPPHTTEYVEGLLAALAKMGPKIVAVTSIYQKDGQVGNIALDTVTGKIYRSMRPAFEGSFHGAGDVFTAAFASLIVRGADIGAAMDVSGELVGDSISRTVERGAPRHYGVDFESALPTYIQKVAKLFE